MYILSIPAFHWIKVPDSQTPQTPKPRAGHTCNLRDGQILVVGGYTGQQTPCESPGIWVFNATSLTWASGFTSLPHPADHSPENHVLANSFGYKVPELVYKVIGGGSEGGATLTTPSAGQPTSGPFATGKPPIFTVTRSGSTATITQWGPGATTTDGVVIPPATPRDPKKGVNGGLIAAGIIAALAGLAAGYLGYCAWLYRRQVRAYKSHLAVANRYYAPAATASTTGFLSAIFGRKSSKKSSKSGVSASADGGGGGGGGGVLVAEKLPQSQEYQSQTRQPRRLSTDTFDSAILDGWAPTEPKTMFGGEDSSDRPSPGSGITGVTSRSGASSSLQPGMMPRPARWWREGGSAAASGSGSGSGARTQNTGTGSGITPDSVPQPRPAPIRRSGSTGGGSTSSTELLLDGQEPSFFSVVLGPRRALRVVNGLEGDGNGGNGGGGAD